MKSKSARTASFVLLTLVAAALTACNTVEGAGEDVSAAGKGISKAADETSKAISGEK